MPMSNNGLTKLIEECGELIQIAAKRIEYPDRDEHPDGKGSMSARLEEELSDVIAACAVVIAWENLDMDTINARSTEKAERFIHWSQEAK